MQRTQLIRTRLALGLSQAQLASMAGVGTTVIHMLEVCDTIPRPSRIPRLAKAYGITAAEFVGILYDEAK